MMYCTPKDCTTSYYTTFNVRPSVIRHHRRSCYASHVMSGVDPEERGRARALGH
jgi:hypothetical protein